MNTEKAIDLLDNLIGMIEDNQENDYDTAFHMAIDALKAQAERTEERTETHACDLISRQAAIGAIVAQTIGYTADEIKAECDENIFNENGYLGGLKDAIEAIEDMSPAQPEVLTCGEGELSAQPERTGRWIDRNDNVATCSVCGERWGLYRMLNFCPHCGADMRQNGGAV